MKLSFRRITSSGSFIPEIDGLRFVAILSVVLFHLREFLKVKDLTFYADSTDYSVLEYIISHGHLGVPLFFVISGFILGMPFAKYRFGKSGRISLKKYFLRRLTRLEPPYIAAMTILLFGAVYIARILTFEKGMVSYLTSLTYAHNIIFPDVLPELNGAAWSLEIEVQFYILAPLMACIFSVRSPVIRRTVLILTAVFFLVFNNFCLNPLRFLSLADYLQYFIAGFLLADLYLSGSKPLPSTRFDFIFTSIFFITIWLFDEGDMPSELYSFFWETVQVTSIFFFYYYVLFHKTFRALSGSFITAVGGMCYSIYLLHASILSLFGNAVCSITFSNYSYINVTVYSAILLAMVLVISSVFFLLIERPCMDKDWYKKIFRRRPLST
ncbi:MAG TPA: acyltransferase [Clostridiales bacterium]|nr:acyltransferase [Clostridiales bacterium]